MDIHGQVVKKRKYFGRGAGKSDATAYRQALREYRAYMENWHTEQIARAVANRLGEGRQGNTPQEVEKLLASYRSFLLQKLSQNVYTGNTVNDKIKFAAQFIKWCYETRTLDELPRSLGSFCVKLKVAKGGAPDTTIFRNRQGGILKSQTLSALFKKVATKAAVVLGKTRAENVQYATFEQLRDIRAQRPFANRYLIACVTDRRLRLSQRVVLNALASIKGKRYAQPIRHRRGLWNQQCACAHR